MANLQSSDFHRGIYEKIGTSGITEAGTTTPVIGPDSLDTTDNTNGVGEYGSYVNSVSQITSTYTTAGKHVIFMTEGTHSYPEPKAVVATVTGDAILYGTRVDTSGNPSSHYDSSKGTSIAYDAANGKVLISHGTNNNHGNYMVVGTISGDSISFGSVATVDSGSTPHDNSMRPQGMVWVGGIGGDTTNRLVLANKHNSNHQGHARVITISGTTPTAHTVASWHTTNEPKDFCMAYVGGGQVVIAYAASNGALNAKVGTVAGGGTNTITWGSAVSLASTNSNYNQLAIAYDEQNSKVLIALVSTTANTRGRYIGATVSGTGAGGTLTFSGAPEFETSGTCTALSAEYHAGAQKILISYKSAGNASPQVIAATYSGTSGSQVTYTFGTAVPLMSASTPLMTTTSYDAVNKKVIVFRDGAVGYKHGLAVDLLTSTLTLDLSTGNYFSADMQSNGTSNIGTFTLSNTNAVSGQAQDFQLKVIQGSIPRQFTWSGMSNIKWNSYYQPGIGQIHRPTISTGNDAVDIFSFTTFDNGTTWYGNIVGQDFS